MGTMRKTIFDLERRSNLFSDFDETISDLRSTVVTLKTLDTPTLMQLMNSCIKTWPYRQGATSINSFASSHGFDFMDCETDVEVINSYELIVNLLYWAPTYEDRLPDDLEFDESSTVEEECFRCIENIECHLERLNYRIRKKDVKPVPQYIISKRDAQVDAVLEAAPTLAEALLSYLDVRNENDEDAKRIVLKTIADHLEQRRSGKFYKGTSYNGLCEDLFVVFNNASIRHKNAQQWKLNKSSRMKLYDQTFKASIHLLQMEDINSFSETIRELKQQSQAGIEEAQLV